jgi:hypothetical protein
VNQSESNPLDDPQLAEAWGAFAHLAAASETVFDESAFTSRLLGQIARRERRKRFVIGTSLLAAAASLLLLAGVVMLKPRGETTVAVVMPEDVGQSPQDFAPAAPVTASENVIADSSPIETENQSFKISPWEDELAGETASLAEQMQTVEKQWRERPNSIALFQSQVDQFEQEIKGGEL